MRINTGIWNDLEANPMVGDASADLVLAFGTREQLCSRGLADRLQSAYPQSVICGCSTAGQFIGADLTDEGVALTTIGFDRSRVSMTARRMASALHSDEVGRKIGATLRSPDLRAVLVLSDGTACNGSALVEGLSQELDPGVTIFGGLAADGADFGETVVLSGGLVGPGVVAAVGFYGDALSIRTGSKGGWEQFGPERTITASEGTVLHRLDEEPALDLYSRYLGDRAAELPGSALLFPLSVRAPGVDASRAVVRTILGVDQEASSMTFAGNVPIGWKAQLMRASFDALIDGAEDAGLSLDGGAVDGPGLCVGVSCVGRRLVLGQRTDEELDAVIDTLPADSVFTGFYSYGELGIGESGECELHNQTMTVTLMTER